MVAFTYPSTLLAVGTVLLSARGAPTSFQTTNALAAQKLNAQFASLTLNDTCADGAQACVQGAFSNCIGGKWLAQQCAGGTTCVVLPLVNKEGTAIACDTQDDAILRMTQAGVDASLFGNNTVVASGATPTATSTTIPDSTSVSTSTASVDPTNDPEDDPECTMDMSTSVAQATSVPTASSSSAVATAATAVASPASTDDGDGEDCTMVENVELAMAPTLSPSATASISGFTRQRLVATGVSDTSPVSAAPSTSPNSASSTSAPVSVATSSATPSGVQVGRFLARPIPHPTQRHHHRQDVDGGRVVGTCRLLGNYLFARVRDIRGLEPLCCLCDHDSSAHGSAVD
ncbi:hypothetical protein PHLGIDRAFT_422345 [Phlebiopsis gigantea 11061_1 CR5-6]|uniref:Carbohydrate-binding module family 19 domain-containing protein n=1 Tax=Phlebiopsis gigantea (strain 11061_1 CR5-6) TaxID=745531 RepID=A0A0C3RYU2_PHLG1|nr:hypothetical protein PHLGIDRAFT_422345 [Phlebiopsis gigantea 11061_1 CR5-6]